MSRVARNQQYYDAELAASGRRRAGYSEYVMTATGLAPIVREIVIVDSEKDFDRTPWWKRQKPRRRRKS